MKFIMGLWAGWIALRVMRGVIAARVGQRDDDARINPDSKATLELVACPKCGIYTAAPCPNCT